MLRLLQFLSDIACESYQNFFMQNEILMYVAEGYNVTTNNEKFYLFMNIHIFIQNIFFSDLATMTFLI